MTVNTKAMREYKNYEVFDDDEINLANRVREGVSFDYFSTLASQIHLNFQEWADYLHLSERTIQRYKKEGKVFDPIYAEKIIIIELLYKKGAEVFGIEENFYAWMDTKSVALGGIKPKDLLDTAFGINMVYTELGRIEHGIFA